MAQIPPRQVDSILFGAVLLAILYSILFSGCSPRIINTETTVTKFDTTYITLPPIIIPPDEFEMGFAIQDLCDSTWRKNHPITNYKGSGSHKLSGKVSFTPNMINFGCRADSLQKLLDSIRVVNSTTFHDKKSMIPIAMPETKMQKWYRRITWALLLFVGAWFSIKQSKKWLIP